MTINEFLEKLEKTRDGWFLEGVFIRKRGRRRGPLLHYSIKCPLTAVYSREKKRTLGTGKAHLAAKRLGLTPSQGDKIMDAADNTTSEPHLRARILKVLGLDSEA